MFGKPTLTDTIKRDLESALQEAHEHSKAAEHHEALRLMFSTRAERLQEWLDEVPTSESKPPRVSPQAARILKAVAEDFPTVGSRP